MAPGDSLDLAEFSSGFRLSATTISVAKDGPQHWLAVVLLDKAGRNDLLG